MAKNKKEKEMKIVKDNEVIFSDNDAVNDIPVVEAPVEEEKSIVEDFMNPPVEEVEEAPIEKEEVSEVEVPVVEEVKPAKKVVEIKKEVITPAKTVTKHVVGYVVDETDCGLCASDIYR